MAVAVGADVRTVRTTRGPVRVRDTGGDGPPVMLVHSLLVDGGFYDRLRPLLVERGFRCLVPHARLVDLPDCAAFAALDQPERLAELIGQALTAA